MREPTKRCEIRLHNAASVLREMRCLTFNAILEPGVLVRHPDQPDWGTGQVQSNIGDKITVNFREMGKVVIDGKRVLLVLVNE